MMALLKGAYKAWLHSCDCGRIWWRHMDDNVVDSEIELRQLRLHRRNFSSNKRKYELQVSQRAPTRRRNVHLTAIAECMGVSRPALLASRPVMVVALFQPTWQQWPLLHRPRAGAELSGVTHPASASASVMPLLVLPPRRRLTHRSLGRERHLIARRYGHGL
jgi:hypothetical protein